MDKITFVRTFESGKLSGEWETLFSAFVSCLAPAETCAALDLEFKQDFYRRKVIVRKIGRDIGRDFEDCHLTLIKDLFAILGQLPPNKRQSCVYCLTQLYGYLPEYLQDQIMDLLLKSKYVGFRRRGYRALSQYWNPAYSDLIAEAWIKHHDSECAQLIIDQFPVEYLQHNLVDLQSRVERSRYLARLHLRLAQNSIDQLETLASTDGITYSYVLAKLGKEMPTEKALEVFERHKYDDRLGLLIWSFGQMKMWLALEEISKQVDDISYARFSKQIR